MTTLLETLAAQKHHAKQDEAVGEYLKQYGQIDRDFAYMTGLPACGRIKNLGGRIHELRTKGWQIETVNDHGSTYYKLIAAPGEQMQLV